MAGNTFQLNRSYTYKHRRAWAYWDARQQENSHWHIHFHADYVPSTDWIAFDTADLFKKIEIEHDAWILSVQHRDESLLAKSTKSNG